MNNASPKVEGQGGNDTLLFNGANVGEDISVSANGARLRLAAGVIGYIADGGDDDDVLTVAAGNDTLLGGAGDDVLIGGPGLDTLDGGPGSNIIIQ